jgi:hypothetical protein
MVDTTGLGGDAIAWSHSNDGDAPAEVADAPTGDRSPDEREDTEDADEAEEKTVLVGDSGRGGVAGVGGKWEAAASAAATSSGLALRTKVQPTMTERMGSPRAPPCCGERRMVCGRCGPLWGPDSTKRAASK